MSGQIDEIDSGAFCRARQRGANRRRWKFEADHGQHQAVCRKRDNRLAGCAASRGPATRDPAGMAATVAAIEEAFSFARLTGVFAASGDKDVPAYWPSWSHCSLTSW